ncbi:MAG: methyltransferase [Cytophagaceae bacterium]
MEFFKADNSHALEAKYKANKIAFGPVAFQAARLLRNFGIIKAVLESKEKGMTVEEVSQKLNLPLYGVKVLMEAGLGMEVFYWREETKKYIATKVGYYLVSDDITRVNLDFVHDVCYEGLFFLEEAILEGKPAGLKVFGNWPTVYEALSQLPPKVQESWFAFDHYYSDQAWGEVLPIVFARNPKKIMDIGGNTGKWSIACCKYSDTIKMTILDLPGQLAMAKENIKKNGFEGRIDTFPINILDSSQKFPKGHDAIWMSQFLDCFSKEEIVHILKRAHEAIDDDGVVYILETYWDRQRFEASSYCLQQTSLYFTCIANGNSQMYHSDDMLECLDKAGLYMEEMIDDIGISHTLMACRKKGSESANAKKEAVAVKK